MLMKKICRRAKNRESRRRQRQYFTPGLKTYIFEEW